MVQVIYKRRRELIDAPAPAQLSGIEWTPDHSLTCPVSGTVVFARVPKMQLRGGREFPMGDVHLRYGQHFGPNSGFGFQHIWAEHFRGLKDHDAALEAVRKNIAAVLRPGTEIRYDAQAGGPKVRVLKVGAGIVILQLMDGEPPIYSVVTGGFHPRENTKGTVIGALV